MTEVTTRNVDYRTSVTASSLNDSDKKVLSVRRYEAKPPENLELVDPDNLIATTKEEEWVTKKKTELTTKKQIETRVKRQVVLEDGKVVEDSGPIVTTNTTEDTEKQEHQQTEHRQIGDKGDGENTKEVVVRSSSLEGNPSLLKEVREKKIKSREEKEEVVETEDVVHLGNISDKAYQEAVQSKRDIREALEESNHKLVHVNSSGPRIVHQSSKNKKVTDTEDTRHTKEVQRDGKIVTETKKTTEHEEVNGVDEPDSVPLPSSLLQNSIRESSHRYIKTKDQDIDEYLANGEKIGEKMRYEAITEEGGRSGDPEQLLMLNGDMAGWESLSERIRRMRDKQQQQQQPPVAGKTLADFDEEERTRKVETAKWLEHHFGSESTRSSTGNLSEEEDDEKNQRTTSNSFINVTMKSTETPVNGYFKGVSEWKPKDSAPIRPPVRRKKELRTSEISSSMNELESSPLFNTVQKRVQGYEMSKEKLSGRNSSNSYSHHHNGYDQTDRTSERQPKTPESPDRYMSWDRRARRKSSEKVIAPEPQPDYSPEPERRASNGSTGRSKKAYQKTRFASTESAPPSSRSRQVRPTAEGGKHERKKSFGESFRRLVSKFTGNKDSAERKKNRKKSGTAEGEQPMTGGDHSGYSDADDDHHENTYRSYDDKRSSADRHHRLFGSTQTLDRHRNGRSNNRRDISCEPSPSRATNGGVTSNGGVQRYYLGEDPFGGSIYGREKEYDGVTTYKRRHNQKKSSGTSVNNHDQPRSTHYVQRTIPVNTNSTTLGRFSKSTGRLLSDDYDTNQTDRSQTLPRKLKTESKIQKQVFNNSSRENDYNSLNRSSSTNTGGSMINVSFANGPAKPQRTFAKPSLWRSQSFNVEPMDPGRFSRRSVSTLHRLEESPPPLKSPNIVSIISRSTKDLQSVGVDDGYRSLSGSWASPGELSNGSYKPRDDPKKKMFMKGLMDQAPELYKSLNHQDDRHQRYSPSRTVDRYSSSGHSSSPITVSHRSSNGGEVTNRSVTRRGSKDDYSETVRITSKSDDPYRPSVTNTVQNFSKKTVPRDGRVETIESSETKTVTKSRYNDGNPVIGKINGFSNHNGGVVIEVRNGRN
ncbi:serine/arginine repetitive matrix protein 2 isoform X2 [Daktulosphaira vitifoliae]|uniref:serine/arginine repetitive matrix protein 2 isoform X2 n=1 Tax=Daktulosphaira vitifoliae TaxID=58002 RepID=UPI0021AA2283|nr:serine/arginine repetitive matrix protein 2 isoform X2 [Daktulosphaira vitifoliae]